MKAILIPNQLLNVLLQSLVCFIILISCAEKPDTRRIPQLQSDGSYLLPNGWKLSPAGMEIDLGGLPLNVALLPDGRYAVVTSNGFTDHFLALVDLGKEQMVDKHPIKKGWIDLSTNKIASSWVVGTTPYACTISSDSRTAYIGT